MIIFSGKKEPNCINKNLDILPIRGCCREVNKVKDTNMNEIAT